MHQTINRYLTTIALVLGIILMAAATALGVYLTAGISQMYPFNPGTVTYNDPDLPATLNEQLYPDTYYQDGEGNECFDPGGGVVCVPLGE